MVSDWETSTLGELAEIVMGQSPKGSECNSDGHGTPLLNGPTEFGSYHPYPTQFTTDPKRFSKKDDLLFCVRGSTTGRMNWSDKEYAIGRGLAAFRHKKGKEFQSFLKGVIDIKLPELLASATGSTFPNVSKNQLNDLEVILPPLPEQKAIAHILGSLDDKIELNRQMNETLEAMAQALFKSWFVDFDPVIDNALAAGNAIPDEFFERAEQRKAIEKKDNSDIQSLFPAEFEFTKEMGWIPKGWSIKKAEEIASITIGKTPPRKESKWFSDTQKDNLVWVSIRDMGNSNVFINDSSEYLTKESIKRFNVKVIPKNSVMLSFKLTLGRVLIAQKELTTNEAIAHFCNPQFSMSKEYIYCYLSNFKYDSLGSTSSIATAVNSKIIKGMPFIVPSEQVLSAFETLSKIYFDKISLVNQQIDSLANLRDTLLPKLMSGELRIADAEVLVDEII